MSENKKTTEFSVLINRDNLDLSVGTMMTREMVYSGLQKKLLESISFQYSKLSFPFTTGGLDLLSAVVFPKVIIDHDKRITGDRIRVYQLASISSLCLHPVSQNIMLVVSYYDPVDYAIPLDRPVNSVSYSYDGTEDKVLIEITDQEKTVKQEHVCSDHGPDVKRSVDVEYVTMPKITS